RARRRSRSRRRLPPAAAPRRRWPPAPPGARARRARAQRQPRLRSPPVAHGRPRGRPRPRAASGTGLGSDLLHFHHRLALVVAAVRADPVRKLGLVAVGTEAQAGSLQVVVGAAAGGARLRMTAFRIRHVPLLLGVALGAGLPAAPITGRGLRTACEGTRTGRALRVAGTRS